MPIHPTVNNVSRELLERAISSTIQARGPGSPTERDLRAALNANHNYVLINGMYFSHAEILAWREAACDELDLREQTAKPVTLEGAVANARTLTQFRHEYMGVPYTGDVDFLVIPAQDRTKT